MNRGDRLAQPRVALIVDDAALSHRLFLFVGVQLDASPQVVRLRLDQAAVVGVAHLAAAAQHAPVGGVEGDADVQQRGEVVQQRLNLIAQKEFERCDRHIFSTCCCNFYVLYLYFAEKSIGVVKNSIYKTVPTGYIHRWNRNTTDQQKEKWL